MAYMALGSTDVPLPTPARGQAQAPIYPFVVGNHGGYLETRSTPNDGSCGVSSYPCKHPGVDVFGMRGTRVVAPESGKIVAVGDGDSAPWVGYGPWLIVIQGASGRFHLLGHLDPATNYMGLLYQPVTAGDQVGTTSSANHTHWEVRKKLTDGDYWGNLLDPIAWVKAGTSSLNALLLLGGGAVLAALLYRRVRR